MVLTLTNNFPTPQLDMVRNDSGMILIIYGTLCYRDAWARSHYTNYCFIYKGRSMSAKDADWCLTHNDSD